MYFRSIVQYIRKNEYVTVSSSLFQTVGRLPVLFGFWVFFYFRRVKITKVKYNTDCTSIFIHSVYMYIYCSIPTFTSNKFVLQFASDRLVNSNYFNLAYRYTRTCTSNLKPLYSKILQIQEVTVWRYMYGSCEE